MGRLLDSLTELQLPPEQRSLSTGSANFSLLNRQRNQLTSAYRRGIRSMRRAARRGDESAAKAEIEMIREAQGLGLQTSGITRSSDREAAVKGFGELLKNRSDLNTDIANRAAAAAKGMPQDGADADPPAVMTPSEAAAGMSPSEAAAGMSPGDRMVDKATRLADLNRRGAFGGLAKERQEATDLQERRKQASGIVDSVLSGESDLGTAARKATEIGGNAYSLTAAINRKKALMEEQAMADELDEAEGKPPGTTFSERVTRRRKAPLFASR